MSYSTANVWYYAIDNQRQGPVSFEELQAKVAGWEVSPATLVWSEGMPDWMQAGQVPELFPAAAGGTEPPLIGGDTASGSNAVTEYGAAPAGGQVAPQEQLPQPYQQPYEQQTYHTGAAGAPTRRVPQVKPANFWLWLGLGVAGFLVYLAAMFIAGLHVDGGSDDIPAGTLMLMALGFAALVASVVLGCMYLYRAWVLVQDERLPARTTPGKAVGFLFIPLFSLYWMFVALHGLAQDYNRMVSAYEYRDAPRMQEGLFLSLPILVVVSVIPFVGMLASVATLVVGPLVFFQICQAVNYFAAKSAGGQYR